jgi:S1-C subfamily serine protease
MHVTRLVLGCCLAAVLVGCPPKQPVEPQGGRSTDERPGVAGREVKQVKLPKSMVIGDNVSLSGFYEDPEGGEMPEGGSTDEKPSVAKGGAGPSLHLYRVVAPATVIVRSEKGYGSGVIYDPAGWILTNNHVVAHAEMDNFRMKVTIGLGRLTKDGVMEQQEKTFDAYVHKKDPLRDMAVVKLIKPPKGLVAVRIADSDPAPGQPVTSIGHAGIGLLWAIKAGQISAVGKLAKHLAELQLYEAVKGKGKAGTGILGSKFQEKRFEELKKYLEKKIPALVIQSTCDISQGDSGGPLVNNRAELVGLNAFVRSTMHARKESNFHIHVSEIRKFIKDVPKKPPQLLPDPWAEGGAVANMGDADLDGSVDVLALYKMVRYGFFSRKQPAAYFLDLDQDSFTGRTPPEVKDVVDKKDFDAELLYLTHGNYLYAWYDTNGDRKHDVLLLADATRKKVTEGYRIDTAGELRRDTALVEGRLIRPELFSDAAMSQRLLAVGHRLFSYGLAPPAPSGQRSYPDPIKSAGHRGTLKDLNRDGKPDTIAAEGLFSSGFIFDADQDSLGSYKEGDSLRQVRTGRIDAELSWIALSQDYWAYYDTDNNGSFDLLLHSNRYPMDVVNEAWRVADGKYTPEPGQLGRLMVQPELLAAPGQAVAVRRLVERVLPSSKIAAGGGIKSFPDPNAYYRFGYRLKEVQKGKKKWKAAALEVRLNRCTGVLMDVDLDTARLARKQKKSVEDLVRDHKYDAEFAQVLCGSDVWTFYDSRGKGAFDVVLYSSRGGSSSPQVAYIIDKHGKVVPRAKAVACPSMVIPGLYAKPALRRAFAKMAPELFRQVADPKCKP